MLPQQVQQWKLCLESEQALELRILTVSSGVVICVHANFLRLIWMLSFALHSSAIKIKQSISVAQRMEYHQVQILVPFPWQQQAVPSSPFSLAVT